jgi:phosphatidylserine decarboxylase
LFQNDELAKDYEDGSVAIFRLAPQDYHRYHAPAACTVETINEIPGTYYTGRSEYNIYIIAVIIVLTVLCSVNPCAVKEDLNVFTENHRCVATLKHNPDGKKFAMVLVGTIVNTNAAKPGDSVQKGEEMGYFQYGGSTVIAVFPKGQVTWDDDLLKNSEQPVETIVKMGDHVGKFNAK